MQKQIMLRYAIKLIVLTWATFQGLWMLPPRFWAIFLTIPVFFGLLCWVNFKDDAELDDEFKGVPYDDYFSVTGEQGKLQITGKQLRSYRDVMKQIARNPGYFRFDRNAISVWDNEMLVARAEFGNPCEMRRFHRDYYWNFLIPYLMKKGLVYKH